MKTGNLQILVSWTSTKAIRSPDLSHPLGPDKPF
uniref:Uncharacterized protein n=1 Tax=Anguilla anguilla TaxID=7936 RepID=A0A0E9XGY8_ANGAN